VSSRRERETTHTTPSTTTTTTTMTAAAATATAGSKFEIPTLEGLVAAPALHRSISILMACGGPEQSPPLSASVLKGRVICYEDDRRRSTRVWDWHTHTHTHTQTHTHTHSHTHTGIHKVHVLHMVDVAGGASRGAAGSFQRMLSAARCVRVPAILLWYYFSWKRAV